MKPTYSIKDWDRHFENHESRKVKRSYWVPVPNRHDGKSFRRIAMHADGVDVFAGWILILEAASKMPTRGVLADEDGPLDADDLAAMTGFPARIFDAAFNLLTQEKFGWITSSTKKARILKPPAISRNLPQSPAVTGTPALEQKGTEGNGTELNGKEGNGNSVAIATGASAASEFTIWKLAVGKLLTVGMEEPAARSFLGGLCKSHGKDTVAAAVTKMLAQEPADPKTYIVGILQTGETNGTTNNRNGYETGAEKRARNFSNRLAIVAELRGEGSGDHHEGDSGQRVTTRR